MLYYNFNNLHSIQLVKMSIATNRKARHEYHILEKYEAGIALKLRGQSIRAGNVSIKESYVRFFNKELFIVGMHIAEYENKAMMMCVN